MGAMRAFDGTRMTLLPDAGVNHGLATDAEHEELSLAGEVRGQRDEILDVLLGQHTGAGGNVTDEGHVAGRAALHGNLRVGVEADLDGAGLRGVPTQVSHLLEGGQVVVDGGGGVQADGLTDLAHRRRVAPVLH